MTADYTRRNTATESRNGAFIDGTVEDDPWTRIHVKRQQGHEGDNTKDCPTCIKQRADSRSQTAHWRIR